MGGWQKMGEEMKRTGMEKETVQRIEDKEAKQRQALARIKQGK